MWLRFENASINLNNFDIIKIEQDALILHKIFDNNKYTLIISYNEAKINYYSTISSWFEYYLVSSEEWSMIKQQL